jgi:hypothetical protein
MIFLFSGAHKHKPPGATHSSSLFVAHYVDNVLFSLFVSNTHYMDVNYLASFFSGKGSRVC